MQRHARHAAPAFAGVAILLLAAGGAAAAERLYDRAEVVARIPVGKRPRGLKLARDGKTLYVALSGSPRGGPGVDESKLPPPDRAADGVGVVDLTARKLVRTYASGQ